MQIKRKSIPAYTVIEAVTTLTMSEIPAYAEKVIPMILAEAENRGMAISGPCIFTYEGCDGSFDREFTMRLAFPVEACLGQGAFVCVRVPAHDCLEHGLSGTHERDRTRLERVHAAGHAGGRGDAASGAGSISELDRPGQSG